MRSWNREFYTKQAQWRGIDRSAPQNPGLLPNRGKAWALGLSCGCGMLFLEAGLLPLLALLNLLPHRDFFGNASSFLVVTGTLPFVVVGLYHIGNASASFLTKRQVIGPLVVRPGRGLSRSPLAFLAFLWEAGWSFHHQRRPARRDRDFPLRHQPSLFYNGQNRRGSFSDGYRSSLNFRGVRTGMVHRGGFAVQQRS